MQSLELVLDDATEAAIVAQWARLADAGLPSQARHLDPSNRPHVTLLARDAIALADVAAAMPSGLRLPLTVGGVILLGRAPRWAVARLIVPSRELLDLHAQLFAAAAATDPGRFEAPGEWTPHVTLARGVRSDQLGPVVETLGQPDALGQPGTLDDLRGAATGVRHWDSVTRLVTPLG